MIDFDVVTLSRLQFALTALYRQGTRQIEARAGA